MTPYEFLARPRSRVLSGPWAAGYALDLHSKFAGHTWTRTETGELAYRLKYGNEPRLARELAVRLAAFIRSHSELTPIDLIVPVPPSAGRRAFQPVWLVAEALSQELSTPARGDLLVKIRDTLPQKEMTNLAQKRANVSGAFAVSQADEVRGKCLMVLDDLLDSGMTMHEVARMLTLAGAARVVILVLTKTIHADE
jgi:predicted amidophosphoribosyltransferase